jgi:hypothetical protein
MTNFEKIKQMKELQSLTRLSKKVLTAYLLLHTP